VPPDSERGRLWERCVTAYFQSLAIAYAEDFWEELLESQHLLIAAGAPYLDERVVRTTTPSLMVSIFQNVEEGGFVAPVGQAFPFIELTKIDERIPAVVHVLQDQFGFTGFKDTDVHHSLHTFALFASKAKRHELDGRIAEAFLHYVIALDLLFGERDSSTASVSKRTTIVVHRALNMTISAMQKMMNSLYDARSKYVHKGIETPAEQIEKIATVCREVLFALLRFQHNADDGQTITNWLKQLDYLYTAADAGKTISEDEFALLGIVTSPE
jgi:hypothetical protein